MKSEFVWLGTFTVVAIAFMYLLNGPWSASNSDFRGRAEDGFIRGISTQDQEVNSYTSSRGVQRNGELDTVNDKEGIEVRSMESSTIDKHNSCKFMHRPLQLPRLIDVPQVELDDINSSLRLLTKAPSDDGGLTLFSLWKKCRKQPDKDCGDMSYLFTSWVILDRSSQIRILREPPYPNTTRKYNPVTRRGKGIKFINGTHVVGLLGSAWEPPYEPYRAFIWNMYTNQVKQYPIHSHHDVEYNPFTRSFLTLVSMNGVRTGKPWNYETMMEVSETGQVLWKWDGSALFTYISRHEDTLRKPWQFCLSLGRRECNDKVHGNTVIWLWEEDTIYFNSRHLDTFYKVKKSTGEVLWGVGRVGHFKMKDQLGKSIVKMVHHAHQLTILGNGKFMLFDNGWDASSYVIVKVDEQHETAQEIWRWTAPKTIFQPAMGGVLRTPYGNVVGALGYGAFLFEFKDVKPANASIIEITHDKKEVWKIQLLESDNFQWLFYRAERFYENPVIRNLRSKFESGKLSITFHVYDSYFSNHRNPGTAYLLHSDHVISCILFWFQPHWLPTILSFTTPCIPGSDLIVAVTNSVGGTGIFKFSSPESVPICQFDCSPECHHINQPNESIVFGESQKLADSLWTEQS